MAFSLKPKKKVPAVSNGIPNLSKIPQMQGGPSMPQDDEGTETPIMRPGAKMRPTRPKMPKLRVKMPRNLQPKIKGLGGI